MTTDRRNFLRLLGSGAVATALTAQAAQTIPAGIGRRVIVVGGGFGGTIAAKTIRMLDPSIEVVLIEPNRQFVACPFSNLYIGGVLPDLSTLTIGYTKLAANYGIQVIHDSVSAIDPVKKTVTVAGKRMAYDRLVLSAGIDFQTEAITGYNPASTPNVLPHAWKAGAQTLLLRKQLVDMPDGASVLMTIPAAPFKCPVAAYERVSMIAMYLNAHKPKSKLLVLDANPDIVTQPALFKEDWEKHYDSIIEYHPAQKLVAVDAVNHSVTLQGGQKFKAQVVNLIPPQRAARIAAVAGLLGPDKIWCPVHANTFESRLQRHVHVIGDACDAGAMPKTGFSANSQAKICAANLVALMNGKEPVQMLGMSITYSYLSAKEAFSDVGVYSAKNDTIIETQNSGALTLQQPEIEATYGASWLKNILTEMSS